MDSGQQRICVCNVAHGLLYGFEEALIEWIQRDGRQTNTKKREAERALHFLGLRGESPLVDRRKKYLRWIEEESINCIRFLLRSWSDISKSPPEFINQFENHCAAMAIVSIEILRRAKDGTFTVPKDIIFHRLPEIFSNQKDLKQHHIILEGLKEITAEIKSYEDWSKYQEPMGPDTIKKIFLEYNSMLISLSKTSPIASENVVFLISIWCNLSMLYQKELSKGRQQVMSDLYGSILEITPKIPEFILFLLDLKKSHREERLPFASIPFRNCLQELQKQKQEDNISRLLKEIKNKIESIQREHKHHPIICSYFSEVPEYLRELPNNNRAV